MTSPFLDRLKSGATEPVGLEDIPLPDELDKKRLKRGQQFFFDHLISCYSCMSFSLICGLSVSQFLEVLVATGNSCSRRKAGYRYFKTFKYVLSWHSQDIWDHESDAWKSLQAVRRMHYNAYKMMAEMPDTDKIYVSQYDMAIVQCGFMGGIVLYAPILDRNVKAKELEDYVYFWRWVGYFLGIPDKYNICIDGYMTAYFICKEIEKHVLLPSMRNPPREYPIMANSASPLRYQSILHWAHKMTGTQGQNPPLLKDRVFVFILEIFFSILEYFPSFRKKINRFLESANERILRVKRRKENIHDT